MEAVVDKKSACCVSGHTRTFGPMDFTILVPIIAELVLRVLERNGIDLKHQLVTATVEKLINAGESLPSIPAKAVELLGYSDLKSEAGKAARVELRPIVCPLNPDEEIVVASEPGEYVCPSCGLDIAVDDEDAEHEQVLVYTCPERHTEEFVSATEGDGYRCQSCGLEVKVIEESGWTKVFHQLSVGSPKPSRQSLRDKGRSGKKTKRSKGHSRSSGRG